MPRDGSTGEATMAMAIALFWVLWPYVALAIALFAPRIVMNSLQYLNDAAVLPGKSIKCKAHVEHAKRHIKSMCPTRWTMRSAGSDIALQNYGAILEALEVAGQSGRDESHTVKACAWLEQFGSCRVYRSLCTVQHIFNTRHFNFFCSDTATSCRSLLSSRMWCRCDVSSL